MPLLDSIVSALGARNPQLGAQAALLPALIEQVRHYPGGLPALIQRFRDGGLSEVINSWAGSGPNLPVSADQLESVLGEGVIGQLSAKSGLDTATVLSQLCIMLPSLVSEAAASSAGKEGPGGGFPLDALSGFLGRM
ncbi:MAG TPA: YidB family protein [Candidimonas sp.]|nr:YidB family protein [Candidimonas sp.]